jgi:hypothetical protein
MKGAASEADGASNRKPEVLNPAFLAPAVLNPVVLNPVVLEED